MTFFWKNTPTSDQDDQALAFNALNETQALIWFNPDGTILDANENFLAAMGYELDEIKGEHHRIFVASEFADSSDYKTFWNNLRLGKSSRDDFSRIKKNGDTIWLHASYNPIFDEDGKVIKVLKLAYDVTESKLRDLSASVQIDAIWSSYAVIEFQPDGTILDANQVFLDTMGYQLDEIKNRHHRMFVSAEEASSDEYAQFWSQFSNGKVVSGEQKRVTKNGKIVLLQANYVPILDLDGSVAKVIKYANDITDSKRSVLDATAQLEALHKTKAVIEFDLKGNIATANDNFLATMGYELSELVGQHHSMFISADDRDDEAYAKFWESLRRGETQDGDFKRAGKNGKSVWIRASYNPIRDIDGQICKIVKFADDITPQKFVIESFEACLTRFAEGDLTARLPDEVSRDFAALKEAYNGSMVRIGELVSGILAAAEAIAQDSAVIASNTNDLSARGEKQASTIEETTAAMEEISVAVKSSADSAAGSSNSAKDAAMHAKKGGGIVGDAVAAMGRIEERSSEISKIVGVIDSIAFQTNLLALNAGVEAARAGDAGKGFSVVASEVRSLAQRASEAARDINQLIEASGKEVLEGARLVNQSGAALDEIVSSVSHVVESIDGISTASDEQSHSIQEVTQAITQIDAATQQTAALSEESAAAANELASRANDLKALASFFTQSKDTTHRPKPQITRTRSDTKASVKKPAAVQQLKTSQQEAAPVVENLFVEDPDMDDWQEF